MTVTALLVSLLIATSAAPTPIQEPVQEPADRDPAAFRAQLDAVVPGLLQDYLTPGAAVALVVDGKTEWIAGYGLADVASGRPVTEDTAFNIGSISKSVAAWGVMKLVEQGKIDLDTPVENYLTRWHIPESQFDEQGVTMRRLLSHTAGLSLSGYPGFDPAQTLPTLEQSLSGATNGAGDVHLIMEPGTQWKYSGGGVTLAQLIVEEVSGRNFAEYMQSEILEPLGMKHSVYGWPDRISERAATPYDGMGRPIPGPRFTALAAAGLQTTAADMARFIEASLTPRVLAVETVRSMQRPANDVSPNYGLGYSVVSFAPDITYIGHGGANTGWMANMGMILQIDNGLMVMTNGSLGASVYGQIFCAWRAWLSGEETVCPREIGPVIVSTLIREGVDAAIARYRTLRAEKSDAYNFSESQLNRAGYALLQAERTTDAIALFALNVEMFPDALNAHDSLGEAYMTAGDIGNAIASYRRSIELNPGNTNAEKMLLQLETMKKAGSP